MDFINFRVLDIIDIVVVAIIILQIYRMIRGTAALTIFVGIFSLYVVWVVVRMLNMELLSMILGQVIGVGVLALLIVFQQEVRRYLLLLGTRYSTANNKILRKFFKSKQTTANMGDDTMIQELTTAVRSMSRSRTGALIVIERRSNLDVYSTTGDVVDAHLSSRLIEAIFFKNSPMHDGAMIIRSSRVHSARCILPSSDNPHIPAHLGMRHRAAIGLSEHSDALVVVVSEETGRVSMMSGGMVDSLDSLDDFEQKLREY